MRAILLITLGTVLAASSASAADAYLDDRSGPAALIRSLYNAINRHEYARAYSYFAEPPAKTLEDYADGYADTESVELAVGTASEEGAAGSIYYNLPVAIRAAAIDGGETVYAGCYTLRLVDATIQGSPFTPLQIESGRLAAAEELLEEAVPERCGDGPAAEPVDSLLEEANMQFRATYEDECQSLAADANPASAGPESYTIEFNYQYDEMDEPRRKARLFRFLCGYGAYNEVHVYFLADDTDVVKPLHFAEPELDIRYENDDPDGAVRDVTIIGYTAQDRLVNSTYDPDTLTLSAHAKWRGIGDASSSGTWIFRAGTFTLVRSSVDASYDGEINPEIVLDYHSGP